jgi:hypothetical protein
VSFESKVESDLPEDEEKQAKRKIALKALQRKRSWMRNSNKAILKHLQDETLNCTNIHLPSVQHPITEKSHGLLCKVI